MLRDKSRLKNWPCVSWKLEVGNKSFREDGRWSGVGSDVQLGGRWVLKEEMV